MSYPKIYEVLPKDIILQIQDYIEGEEYIFPNAVRIKNLGEIVQIQKKYCHSVIKKYIMTIVMAYLYSN